MMKKAKLKNVNLDEIELGDRYREEYDVEDLLESIPEVGILQPISVLDLGGSKYRLVTGGRRYTACAELSTGTIPALIYTDLSELSIREIEFLENYQRKDLTWQETNKQTAGLHKLMMEMHPNDWSQRKTAQILDRAVGGINRVLQLATMIENFPYLATLPTEDQAVRGARKLMEGALAKSMAKEHEAKATLSPAEADEGWEEDAFIATSRHAANHFRIGDCIVSMKEMSDSDLRPPIALVEVDPPYGIDLKEQKKGDTDHALDKYNEIERADYQQFTLAVCEAIYDCTPDNTRIIYWFGIEYYSVVKAALEETGFSVDPIPCIWTKAAGQTNSPDLYLARTWEPFFVATKGKGTPIVKRGRSNVFNFPTVSAQRKYHPTQRPIELMEEILDTFAFPGAIVMVPFLGSGVTLRAAYQKGINAFGWELNEHNKEYFLAAVENDIQEYKDSYIDPPEELETEQEL